MSGEGARACQSEHENPLDYKMNHRSFTDGRFAVPFAFAAILFTNVLCPDSIAQSMYPLILPDSGALAGKINYLQNIHEFAYNQAGPNIIIILADDLGKNDISLYDSNGVNTPNINRLAREGVAFTEAYSTSAVCNPSRAGLLTGRYQQRFGNERQIMSRYPKNGFEFFIFKNLVNTRPLQLIDPWYSPPLEEIRKQGLPESEISLFELMHSIGYRIGCIGKWHLGYNEPYLPQNKNIDEFYGFYEAFSLYAPKGNKDIINHKHRIFQNRRIWRQQRKGPSAIVHNGQVIEEKGYLTERIAEEACRFIRQNENDPFLLYIPFNAPHTPFQVPRSYFDRFPQVADENKRVYYAMIAALDDAVGEIMKQVKESGIEENTLIFFCSDNGGATYTGATENGDLKGGKMTYFEGGLNVPFIMKWKGTVAPGYQYNEPVSLMDIFTTAVSSCQVPLPENVRIDGMDLVPYLSGEKSGPPHEYLFWRTDFSKAVRNGHWKMIVNSRDDFLLLYDLQADKQEQYDLKTGQPEIVKQLLGRLTEWESGLKPPLWPGVMEYEEEFDGVNMRFAF
jgi:arylsulfatase A-like enzyme